MTTPDIAALLLTTASLAVFFYLGIQASRLVTKEEEFF